MRNPIIKKNIRTELSFERLLMMPVVIGGIFALLYFQSGNLNDFMQSCQHWSFILIGVFLFLGGNLVVAEGLANEINSRTWVGLRMTSLSAGSITLGKLFGENIFIWYCTLLTTIPYISSSYFSTDLSFISSLKYLVLTLIAGIFSHAVTMLLCFIGIRKQNDNWKKVNSNVFAILGILVAGGVIYYISQLQSFEQPFVKWNYIKIKYEDLSILSFAIFTFWAVFGVYQNMRGFLNKKTSHVAWGLFIFTVMLYFCGYITIINALNTYETSYLQLISAIFIGAIIALVLAFAELKKINEKKQLIQYLSFKNTYKAEATNNRNSISLWAYTIYFLLALTTIEYAFIGIDSLYENKLDFISGEIHISLPISILLFLLRDICILIIIYSFNKIKRAGMISFIVLMFLYLLLPSIVSFLVPILKQTEVTALESMASFLNHETLFYPIPFGVKKLWGVLPPLVQFLIALGILMHRWTKIGTIQTR